MRARDIILTRKDLSKSVNIEDINIDECINYISKAADEPEFVLKKCFTCGGLKKKCEDYTPFRAIRE